MFGAAVVTHAAAAQNEDDCPNQPKPYGDRKSNTVMSALQLASESGGNWGSVVGLIDPYQLFFSAEEVGLEENQVNLTVSTSGSYI